MSHSLILLARPALLLIVASLGWIRVNATEPQIGSRDSHVPSAERGYQLLVDTPFLSSDFTQEVFENLWQSWPEPLRTEAAAKSPADRQAMAFERYGLTARPDDPSKPLQYVVDDDGNWTMNCFACHGGKVFGETLPGSPNNRYGLQTLTEEIRSTKFRMGKPLTRMDLGSMVFPLGTTHGTTNAVFFGVELLSHRDADLNLVNTSSQPFAHHDMDAPPWWHFYKRSHLYIDGFAEKGHRGLMQFILIPENRRDFFIEHEDDFRDIYAYLSSLRAPKFPGEINQELAKRGGQIFDRHCSECHGTYGDEEEYPNRRIPIADLNTDPVRLEALNVEGRQRYAKSWFAHGGEADQQATVIDPGGYVAPPLDGIWATPPYFHNGSVPTLWHVLNPGQRPTVWRRTAETIDSERVGFQIESVIKVPFEERDAAVRRSYFDTRRTGKSNAGHNYPSELSLEERKSVLEYLKTL